MSPFFQMRLCNLNTANSCNFFDGPFLMKSRDVTSHKTTIMLRRIGKPLRPAIVQLVRSGKPLRPAVSHRSLRILFTSRPFSSDSHDDFKPIKKAAAPQTGTVQERIAQVTRRTQLPKNSYFNRLLPLRMSCCS